MLVMFTMCGRHQLIKQLKEQMHTLPHSPTPPPPGRDGAIYMQVMLHHVSVHTSRNKDSIVTCDSSRTLNVLTDHVVQPSTSLTTSISVAVL